VASNAPTTKPSNGRPAGLFTWIAIGLVVVVIAVLVVVKVTQTTAKTSGDSATSAAMVSELTGVPASVFDAVGTTSPAAPVTAPTVTKAQPELMFPSAVTGKKVPGIVYVGGEFCPYCAAERWSVIVALSRFGTWSGLRNTESYTGDVYGGTKSFSFANAAYSSPYIAFKGFEQYTNQLNPATNYYYVLDKLPALKSALFGNDVPASIPTSGIDTTTAYDGYSIAGLFTHYDTSNFIKHMPAADDYSYPFMTMGNQYLIAGAQYTPALLNNLSRDNIASGLSTASSPITAAIIASANYLTAAVCKLTHNQPAAVCSSSAVATANKTL
jgi:hypothetical protein